MTRRAASSRVGETYGLLTIERLAGRTTDGRALASCRCACGGEIVTRIEAVASGFTRSCGCVRAENARQIGRASAAVQRGRRLAAAHVAASVAARAAAAAIRAQRAA